ncbi:MAG: hypothetical protein Q8P22_09675 [Chloroflexota bacterium]|nr:hypothetical protein [Chloroflexota bacterium]
MSRYRDALVEAMTLMAEQPASIFLGQSVLYPGHIMFSTIEHIPASKRLELPVMEDAQMGMSLGLALVGYHPVVSIYPRMDFLILALNQLVNHLDKAEVMSQGQFKPKVLIRTMVGSTYPLYPGPQHCQDHTAALKLMLTNVDVVRLERAEEIVPAYQKALASPRSTILVEAPRKRQGYEDEP